MPLRSPQAEALKPYPHSPVAQCAFWLPIPIGRQRAGLSEHAFVAQFSSAHGDITPRAQTRRRLLPGRLPQRCLGLRRAADIVLNVRGKLGPHRTTALLARLDEALRRFLEIAARSRAGDIRLPRRQDMISPPRRALLLLRLRGVGWSAPGSRLSVCFRRACPS